ncbi:hypothetical protein Q4498_04580 [Neptunomonas phycophila]|nr:hypothetical protein [Neptunomonas phycophila]
MSEKEQAPNIEKNAFISTLDFSKNLCRFTLGSGPYQANPSSHADSDRMTKRLRNFFNSQEYKGLKFHVKKKRKKPIKAFT